PENFSNEPRWLPVTFDPMNSIFEVGGLIRYFSPAVEAAVTGAALLVTALCLSAAGSHAVNSTSAEIITISLVIKLFPPGLSVKCSSLFAAEKGFHKWVS